MRRLLSDVADAGIYVHTPDGVNLTVDAPKGALTGDLRRRLSDQKEAIIAAIQRREALAFSSRGWLAIHSEHLGEVVITARDEQAAADAPAGAVVYTADEIELLRDVTPDELRQVHEAKKFWNGRITSKGATTSAG